RVREDVRFAGAQPAEPGAAATILATPAQRPRGYRAGYGLKAMRDVRAGTKAEARRVNSIGRTVQSRLAAITAGLENRVNVVEAERARKISEAANAVPTSTPRAGIA